VGILQNPHVDANHVVIVNIFQRRLVRFLFVVNSERGVPLSSGFFLERDFFDALFVWDVSVALNRNIREFRE